MKWYLWLVMITLVGCSTVKSTPTVDTKAQDVAFEVALKASVESSHKEEMEALTAQSETLARIEESVEALKPSSTPVQASEPVKGPETLETDESVPSNAVEPQKAVESASKVVKVSAEPWPTNLRVVYWYGIPCVHCENMTDVIDALKNMDVPVRSIEVFHVDDEGVTVFSEAAMKYKVDRAPTVMICNATKVLKRFEGVCTIEDILDAAEELKMESIVSSCMPEKNVTPLQSVMRVSGPRWNWNGSWNVSNQYAESHLRQSHGIEADGLSMSELQALHDNAHNGYSSQPVLRSSPVKVQTSYRSNSRRGFFRFRSSCPGGNCP